MSGWAQEGCGRKGIAIEWYDCQTHGDSQTKPQTEEWVKLEVPRTLSAERFGMRMLQRGVSGVLTAKLGLVCMSGAN